SDTHFFAPTSCCINIKAVNSDEFLNDILIDVHLLDFIQPDRKFFLTQNSTLNDKFFFLFVKKKSKIFVFQISNNSDNQKQHNNSQNHIQQSIRGHSVNRNC